MEGNGKNYWPVTVTENIYLDTANHRRIFKVTNDHAFGYDGKPGFKDVYSCDPDSADYDPSNYNRCLTVLHEHGIALDMPLAPVHSRRLRDRWPLLSPSLRLQIARKLVGI
jgi:hypothetical protein